MDQFNSTQIVASGSLILLTFALYKTYGYIYRPTDIRNLKGPSNPGILLGHLAEVRDREPGELYAEWAAQYGHVLRLFGPLNDPMLLTSDLRALGHILHRSDVYEKPMAMRVAYSHIMGWGVLTSEGEHHRLQRKALNPAFGAAHIRNLTGIFLDKANQLRDAWNDVLVEKDAMEIESLSWFSRATLDIIGLAGFGYDFNSLEPYDPKSGKTELHAVFRDLVSIADDPSLINALVVVFPFLRHLPITRNNCINVAMSFMRRIGTRLLKERKEEVVLTASQGEKATDTRARDLIALLVRANTAANPQERLSDEAVLSQVTTLLLSGHETSATLLAWIAYRLASHPDVLQRLRAECRASISLGPGSVGNAPLTHEELTQLDKQPLMDAVIRESLRLHSPGGDMVRQAVKDDIIPLSRPYIDAKGREHDTIHVSAGDNVIVPVLMVHNDEEIWGPDAKLWNPDRWMIDPSAAIKQIPGQWGNILAFSGGLHGCIGYKFSIIETKVMLHVLATSFDFEMAIPDSEVTTREGIINRPFVKSELKRGAQMPVILKKLQEGQ